MKSTSRMYGVLSTNNTKDIIREASESVLARIVIPSPRGDGSSLELYTEMYASGNYHVYRRDEKGSFRMIAGGDIHTPLPVTWEECQAAGVPYDRAADLGNTSSKAFYESFVSTEGDETT